MNKAYFRTSTRIVAFAGILVALQIVMARLLNFAIGPNLRVNPGFLPVAAAGMLLGPVWAALVAAAGDILGNALFPTGPLHLGFTLTAVLGGINYGLWLYQRKITIPRAIFTILPVIIVCNILLNTFFLWTMRGDAVLADIPVRILKNLLQFPVNAALLYGFGQLMERVPAQLRSF